MDPITTAILAVLPGIASGTLSSLVKDSYEGLKAVIRRKWGESGSVTTAIAALEQDPTSSAHASTLNAEVIEAKASSDKDVVEALQALVMQLKSANLGGPAVTSIQFNQSGGTSQGVGAAQTVNVGSMTFGTPDNG